MVEKDMTHYAGASLQAELPKSPHLLSLGQLDLVNFQEDNPEGLRMLIC
jgi:hypothetical protein